MKKLFGNNIPPACEYCEFGKRSADGLMILCRKKGVVSPFFSCRRFIYAPVKRIPQRRPLIQKHSADEFKL